MDSDIDNIIAMLLSVKKERPGMQVNLPEEWIRSLCGKAQEIFKSQPMLLRLKAPIQICGFTLFTRWLLGDIHGQYYDLLRLFEYGGYPPKTNYLFLGFATILWFNIVTMWTVGSKVSSASVFYSPIKWNIPISSSFSEEITKPTTSTKYTVSTTNASVATTFVSGRPFQSASNISLSLP